MGFFLDVLPQPIDGKVYDHIMNRSLIEFNKKFNDPQAVSQIQNIGC
jgi:hypothetical protein